MNLFQALLGNATETNASRAEEIVYPFLVEGETILKAYRLIRDFVVATDLRLLIIDRRGASGLGTDVRSIPYRSIQAWSRTSASPIEVGDNIRLWLVGQPNPVRLRFAHGSNSTDVFSILSHKCLTP